MSRRTTKSPTEAQLHATVTQYLSLALQPSVVVHHSPNEGRRSFQAQRALKSNGVRKGWPDIELVAGGKVYFVELKAAGRYPSPAQQACHGDLERAGCKVAVARSLKEVETVVRAWGLTRWRRCAPMTGHPIKRIRRRRSDSVVTASAVGPGSRSCPSRWTPGL